MTPTEQAILDELAKAIRQVKQVNHLSAVNESCLISFPLQMNETIMSLSSLFLNLNDSMRSLERQLAVVTTLFEAALYNFAQMQQQKMAALNNTASATVN